MKRASITEENTYRNALDRLTGGDRTENAPPRTAPARSAMKEAPSISTIKLSVFLNSNEDAYLESLASTAKFTGGKKLSKTRLVEAMVRAFSTTELDVKGVKTGDELLQRLSAQLRK